jgi:hypothetical protein
MGWVIESSPAAQAAFATAIASPYYSAERFGQIAVSPIPPHWAGQAGCAAAGCVYLPEVSKQ